MANDGLVSIITPCFNGEKYIAETIKSVLRQTYANWEMIIVDDGSQDHSAQIAALYAEKDPRISVLSQGNAGTACARNAGIRRAAGRYIALLDADDTWSPDFLERQLAFMAAKDAECVCCAYRRIDEQSHEIQHPTVPKAVITPKDMWVMNRVGCLTGLYDASRHGKVFLHEELKSMRDDYAYWYDIATLTGKVYGNPEVLASYRVLSDSTTGRKLGLVHKQYRFYRQYLRQGRLSAAVNTVRWGISGIFKFI